MLMPLGAAIAAGANIIGGAISGSQNRSAQREFAKKGIQWRVQDAQRAGIHPLYAVNANVPTYTPTANVGDGIASAGQDLSRAAMATQTAQERELVTKSALLSLERQELENDLLRSQIAVAHQPGQPPAPPAPASGSGVSWPLPDPNVSPVEYIPQEVSYSHPGNQAFSPAPMPEVTVTRTQSGGFAVVPSPEMAESLESAGMLSQGQWWIRNNIVPWIQNTPPPHAEEMYPGEQWTYNVLTGEWRIK